MDLRSTASGSLKMSTDMNGLLAEHLATVRMDIWSNFEQMMTLIKQRAEALQKESSRQLEADISELRMENRTLREKLKVQADAAEVRRVGTRDVVSHQSSAPHYPPPNSVCWIEEISDPVGTGHDMAITSPSKPKDGMLANVAEDTSVPADPVASELDSSECEPEDLPLQLKKSDSKVRFSSSVESDINYRSSLQSDIPTLVSHQANAGKGPSTINALPLTIPKKRQPNSKIFGTKSVTKFFGVPVQEEEKHESSKAQPYNKVFADSEAMKERVRAAVTKPEYNVADYYWTTGWCQHIARHPFFEYATLGVIAFNAIWIFIDVDFNDKELLLDAHPVFQIAENFFCIFFTFEWAIRFSSFREKRFGLNDAWFCFDTVLVVIMILETWALTLLFLIIGSGTSSGVGNTSVLKLVRLVRLTRMARMAKLLRAVPELIILIKGIWVAARSVLFTLLLLFIIIYVFAIVLRQITSGSDIGKKYYRSVPVAMSSLLLEAVLPDQASAIRDNGDAHFLLGLFFLLFILLSSLTVMNMLVGILCEVVSVVSAVEKEQLTVNYVKAKLESIFMNTMVDQDNSKTISKVEFESILTNEETARIIQDIGVDVIGLVDFVDIIFEDDIELSFGDFMELVMQLRGTNNCTVKDMVDLRKFVVTELNVVQGQTIQAMYEIMGTEPETHPEVFEKRHTHAELPRRSSPTLKRANSRHQDLGRKSLRKSKIPTRPLPLGQPIDLPGSTIT